MSRPFSLTKAKNGNGRRPERSPDRPAPESEAELLPGPAGILPDRYESRPARPFTAIAIRVALWGAVALGCVGGLVGLLRPPAEPPPPVAGASADELGVPAPVAGMAELVVREWLTATPEEEAALVPLFVERPILDGLSAGDLRVGRVTTIAGKVLQEEYWAVTVEAEVTETIPVVDPNDPGAAEDPGAEQETERRASTWYLEVPIVGNPETGLLALTRPAVLPGPPTPSTGWRASLNRPQEPNEDDPTLQTVEGFFDALLAGTGDPGRYVAPGVEVAPADPPLFADTEVVDLAIDQLREGEFRVLAQIEATTPGGAHQMFSYELVVVERIDRLEITHFAGAPTRIAGSAQPEEDDDADDDSGGENGTGGDTESPGTTADTPATTGADGTTGTTGTTEPGDATDPAAGETPAGG